MALRGLRASAHRARAASAGAPPAPPATPTGAPWDRTEELEDLSTGPAVIDASPEVTSAIDEAGGFSIEGAPGVEDPGAYDALTAEAPPIDDDLDGDATNDVDGETWVEALMVDATEASPELDPDAPRPLRVIDEQDHGKPA